MNPVTMLDIILLVWMLVATATLADDRCEFPVEWKGKWYQSGLGEVIIRERLISKKGQCYDHQRDYYLVRNREQDCYQCLLLMERHSNIIQYKESYCLPLDTLKNICAQIRVETPLYTLVREPAEPTKCPFKDAFYFDYNDQASGFCDTPISYAKPCAGHTKYQMHFKHCKEYVMFHNSDLDLSCVASWKDGSDTYMYGQFAGPGIATKDDSYRCFKYQHYGTEMYMAMSVDATCQGLRTPQDGPITIKFTKDIYGWQPPSCSYPDWLTDVTWRDIDGRNTFSFLTDARVMTGSYRKRVSTEAVVQSEHRCAQVMRDGVQDGQRIAIIYSFTTNKCMSKHQCLKFIKTRDGKVQFYQGVMGDYDSGRVCLTDDDYGDEQILMEENRAPIDCPMPGSYLMQYGEGCHQRINIGCSNRTLITVSVQCGASPAGTAPPAVSMLCLLSWEDSGRIFLLAKEPNVDSRHVTCFSFKERNNMLHYTTGGKCDATSGSTDKSVKYEHLERESCDAPTDTPAIPAPSVSGPVTSPHETMTSSHSGDHGLTDDSDYSDIDFRYSDPIGIENSNPAPRPPPSITPIPDVSSREQRRRDREQLRRERNRERNRKKQQNAQERQSKATREEFSEDVDLALSDEDLPSVTRSSLRDSNTEVKPYPKYTQVDHTGFSLPTNNNNIPRQHTSAADVLHTHALGTIASLLTLLVLFS